MIESDGTMASIRRYDLNSIGDRNIESRRFQDELRKKSTSSCFSRDSDGSKVFMHVKTIGKTLATIKSHLL